MGKDKVFHFIVELALGLTALLSYPFAIGIAIGAGIGKEVGDYLAKGSSWDWKDSAKDLVADALGAGLGIFIAWLLRR